MLIWLHGLYNLPEQERQNRMLLAVIHSANIDRVTRQERRTVLVHTFVMLFAIRCSML